MIQKLIAAATLVFIAAFVLVTATDAGAQAGASARLGRAIQAPAGATMKPDNGPLPELPRVSFEPPRPMPYIKQVYEFAARHPEVLQYVPCYCGCERVGHTANHSCFIKSRAANGRVTEWDSHGIGCAICMDVAHDAMTLFNAGQSPAAIRAAIDKKYGSHFPSSTPTPLPPRAKG